MKIIVCLKQVPNTSEVKINKETGTLIRDGIESIINPDDKYALEMALKLKDKYNAEVTILTMGPAQAKDAINEGLSMGADMGILLTDRAFAGSDTWATATILSAAVEKIKDYDIIICGRQAIDGDTAQVGPEMAEFLNLPQITYVNQLDVRENKVIANRYFEDRDIKMEVDVPVLITVIKGEDEPRYPTAKGIFKYFNQDFIKEWTIKDLDTIDISQIGLKGSPTNVYKSFVPVKEKKVEIIKGDIITIKNSFSEKFKELKLI
ncbi:MAG: electron transfer flavoprotein subunit beta/FixA family protein [Cetobacterium sp.]|uniref:electron transfer flavoprotein subunit beta/FixA family protein n=2 Tax=Cetobacterium sp. TaxID=2071632 RepID=UPI002FC75753